MSNKGIKPRSLKKQTLAEQMAEEIQEQILAGGLESGATLPTEPDLADQFGVSRAVVRDATRILMARGLVEVQHGRGVFVTQPDNESFGQALLLALRRVGASAWDVEQFEGILLPEIIALAATNATGEDLANIYQSVNNYSEFLSDYYSKWLQVEAPLSEQERFNAIYRGVMQDICLATHNMVIGQLAVPLLNLRNLRNWASDPGETLESAVDRELTFVQYLVEAIESQNSDHAKEQVSRLMELPPEAIQAMQDTPVGEIAEIPVPLPKLPDI